VIPSAWRSGVGHQCGRPAREHITPGPVDLDVIDLARRVMALVIGYPSALASAKVRGSWLVMGLRPRLVRTTPGDALPLPVGIIRYAIASEPPLQFGMRIISPIGSDRVGVRRIDGQLDNHSVGICDVERHAVAVFKDKAETAQSNLLDPVCDRSGSAARG
jgi:hypothetical protein